MTALDKLIEAVEAGNATEFQFYTWRPGLTGTIKESKTMWRAFNGSLDAALALHEALLPGRTLSVGQNAHHGDWNAWVRYAEDGEILDEYTAASDTAARSLLLAILRAYRSVVA